MALALAVHAIHETIETDVDPPQRWFHVGVWNVGVVPPIRIIRNSTITTVDL